MNEQNTTQVFESIKTDLARAVEIKAQLESVKPLYEELDAVTMRASEALRLSKTVDVNGVKVTLIDNFESKNTVFRPVGVKRFELSVESVEEYAARLDKEAAKAVKAAKKAAKEGA